MALKDILQVIATDADREVAAIRSDSNEASAVRLQQAETELAAARQRILAEAQTAAEQQAARLLHRAHLETLRLRVEVQEIAFRAAIRRAREIIESARARTDYNTILGALLEEALAGSDEEVTIVVHPDDAEVIGSLLQQKDGSKRRLETSPEVSLGVVVRSQDGRVVIENTLHSRLARAVPDLRAQLADLLSDIEIISPGMPQLSPGSHGH